MTAFQHLHDLCVDRNLSVVTAESCSAGLLSSNIASIAGASSFFKGGVISYQNKIKIDVLGVCPSIINQKTEVSSEVAEQMAEGVRCKFSADFSIAITGYAGPTGGDQVNPIGTVFIAVSSKEKVISKRFLLKGSRYSIVSQSVNLGVEFLIEELKKQH